LFAGQPLFGCVDKVGLPDGVNDLMVTCRIVSMNDTLTGIKVRVFGENDRNFTIDAGFGEEVAEKIYDADERYGVRVVPSRSTVRIVMLIMQPSQGGRMQDRVRVPVCLSVCLSCANTFMETLPGHEYKLGSKFEIERTNVKDTVNKNVNIVFRAYLELVYLYQSCRQERNN